MSVRKMRFPAKWITVTACIILIGLAVTAYAVAAESNAALNSNRPLAPTNPFLSSELIISALANEQHLPAVAYNRKHHEYLVVWHNTWGNGTRDIYAQRLTDKGEFKDGFTIATGPKGRAQPSVAYDPVRDRYLVVWTHDVAGDGSNWDISGRFVPWNGPPSPGLSEFKIIDWSSSQWNPKVVYAEASDEFMVVWTNTPAFVPAYVSGRRIFADGSGFPGGGFTIATHLTENRVNADVAYNLARNEYLVTYDNVLDIFGTRLRGDGASLGGGEFPIAEWPDQEHRPAVAACHEADQYLVAWQSLVSPNNDDVFARFVNGNGTVDSVHHIGGTAVDENYPDVTCNVQGRQYMVTWQQQYSNTTGPYGIWGRRLLPDKTLYPPFTISAPIAGRSMDRTDPAIVGGHANFMVVWEHDRFGTTWQDIHGRLVSPHVTFLPIITGN